MAGVDELGASAVISFCNLAAIILHWAARFFAELLNASELTELGSVRMIGFPVSEPVIILECNGISPMNGMLNCSLIFFAPPSPKM